MEYLSAFFNTYGVLLAQGTWDTIVMSLISTFFAYVLGIPLGIAVVLTRSDGLHPHKVVNMILGWIVNIGRSIPFIILLVAIIPFTRLLVGTSLGIPGAIVPLVVSAAPFVARMVEQSILEVDSSLVEAAQSFGANTWQIITKVYLSECLPSLIRGGAIVLITLLGYSAMAGMVGAGGLGDIAVRYGYQRYNAEVMIATIIILVILVQIIQTFFDRLALGVDKKKR